MNRLRHIVPPECLVMPDSPEYEQARLVYNRMHDARPAALVRSLDTSVLTAAITAAAGAPLAVRGGGHHIGGFSTVPDGLVLDFTPFRAVEYDPMTELVRVQPGARLGDVDTALAAYGRCVPTGTVSDTGITGLTLGGGVGGLVAGHGLTCDYLNYADVLLSDGRVIRASAREHTGLFAALRGGGVGAFGVILSLCYRTLPLPRIVTGSVQFPLAVAARTLSRLKDILTRATPSAVTIAPTLNRQGLSVDMCCSGDPDALELFRTIGGDWSDMRERPYIEWQRTFDQAFLPPMRGYWKSAQFTHLDVNPDFLVDAVATAPSGRCSILIEYHNPTTLRAHAAGSAFPLRDSRMGVLFSARWLNAIDDEAHIQWTRRYGTELRWSRRLLQLLTRDRPQGQDKFQRRGPGGIPCAGGHLRPDRLFARGHRAALGEPTAADRG